VPPARRDRDADDRRRGSGASIVVDGGLMLTAAEFNREAAAS
jgi:hypothetical protein